MHLRVRAARASSARPSFVSARDSVISFSNRSSTAMDCFASFAASSALRPLARR